MVSRVVNKMIELRDFHYRSKYVGKIAGNTDRPFANCSRDLVEI